MQQKLVCSTAFVSNGFASQLVSLTATGRDIQCSNMSERLRQTLLAMPRQGCPTILPKSTRFSCAVEPHITRRFVWELRLLVLPHRRVVQMRQPQQCLK